MMSSCRTKEYIEPIKKIKKGKKSKEKKEEGISSLHSTCL